MKKFGAIILAILAGILLVGGVLYVAGPSLIESRVEEELTTRLNKRGVEAEWSAFEAGYGGEFVMTKAKFRAEKFGAELEADTISVRVDPWSAFEDTPHIDGVDLSGVRVRVDLAALDDESDDSGGGSGGSSSGTLRAILESPPGVELTDVELVVVRGEDGVGRIAATRASFEPIARGWYVTARGSSKIDVEDVPEVFQEELPWDVTASLLPLDRKVDFRVSGPDGAPLVALEEKELVRAEVGAVSAALDLKALQAKTQIENVMLRLGPEEAPGIGLTVERTRVDLEGTRVRMIAARNPKLTVTPSKLGPVRAGLSWLQALAGKRPADKPVEEDPTHWTPPRYRVMQAWRAATRFAAVTDLYVEGASLDIKIESALENEFDAITVMERLDARAVGGNVTVDGTTAGGTIMGATQLIPGSLWPTYVDAAITDVNLAKMPGMPKKRSELPSRGTSGRVGGEFDAVFGASFPMLGSQGSLTQGPSFAFGSFDWSDGVIDLTGVSDEPLEEIDLSFDFIGRGIPALNDFDVLDATLTYGPAVVRGRGSFTDAPLDPTFVVRAELEEIECQKLFRSAPVGLLGPYRAIEMEGKWAPKFYMKLPLFRPRGFRMDIEEYEDLCKVTDLKTYNKWLPEIAVMESAPTGPHLHARPLPEERLTKPRWDDVHWLNAPFVKKVTEGVSSEEVNIRIGPGLKSYVPLHEMPGYVGGAAYLSEEMDFYDDGPINLNLIKKAVRLNLEKGRFQYGGSTVTQQLVKNLFLKRDKTFARKFQEALIAWRITTVVSKERVLELYLNCIEYGPDVYGIGRAAQYYFQKDARQLTAEEAIFLAMLKPAPWYGAKVVERGKTPVTGWWAGRIEELYGRLIDYGYLTKAQAEAEKPYVLEWDKKTGAYKPAASDAVPELDMGLELEDLLDVDPQ